MSHIYPWHRPWPRWAVGRAQSSCEPLWLDHVPKATDESKKSVLNNGRLSGIPRSLTTGHWRQCRVAHRDDRSQEEEGEGGGQPPGRWTHFQDEHNEIRTNGNREREIQPNRNKRRKKSALGIEKPMETTGIHTFGGKVAAKEPHEEGAKFKSRSSIDKFTLPLRLLLPSKGIVTGWVFAPGYLAAFVFRFIPKIRLLRTKSARFSPKSFYWFHLKIMLSWRVTIIGGLFTRCMHAIFWNFIVFLNMLRRELFHKNAILPRWLSSLER